MADLSNVESRIKEMCEGILAGSYRATPSHLAHYITEVARFVLTRLGQEDVMDHAWNCNSVTHQSTDAACNCRAVTPAVTREQLIDALLKCDDPPIMQPSVKGYEERLERWHASCHGAAAKRADAVLSLYRRAEVEDLGRVIAL